jgi:asparagine synthase (glutamine-hydrolysing)
VSHPRVRVIATARHPWRRIELDGGLAYVTGDPQKVDTLAANLLHAEDHETRASLLNSADFLFGAIVETAEFALAACDVVRSTPVFLARTASGWVLGNQARELAGTLMSETLDQDSLLEIEMAGYATGGATVYTDLRALECGSYVVLDQANTPNPRRYFRYKSDSVAESRQNPEQLGAVIDATFAGLVRRGRGRPILVPISGGLDSRLVLAKLVEHRYANLACFSYGTPGNTDARAGREVAAQLGVPWQFVPSHGAAHRAFFTGEEGRAFWRFADGLACVPNPQDIVPLVQLRSSGALEPGTIVVNGQTGDFLSGGHIPAALRAPEVPREKFLATITAKHYGLWRGLAIPEHLHAIETRIQRITGTLPPVLQVVEAIALYELWEYEARQSAWVVNAQRTYEYLGLDWDLPLWSPALVRFFCDASFEAKIGQRLYREYLARWNYRGLFEHFARSRSSWPRSARPLALVEKGARILGGAALQQRVNATLRYFGHYRHQYAELSFRQFMAVRHDMRHILGHHARNWLAWNGFPSAAERA